MIRLAALFIGYAVLVSALWYMVGFVVNSLLYSIVLTWPWHRSRKPTPNWLYNTYYFTIGPLGWTLWITDNWRAIKATAKRWLLR